MILEHNNKDSLADFICQNQARVQNALENFLPSKAIQPQNLHDAMRYSVEGGKNIRASLIYAVGQELSGDISILDRMASAIEMVHAFSLVHDDLPAIDNDDLRRGKSSCHKKFGEATAIMAGDALIALAIEILSQEYGLELKLQRKIINIISCFMGSSGLIGGEMLDIEITEKKDITINYLQEIYLLKTGKLLSATVQIAAISSQCDDKLLLDNLNKFSENIGLAFQIYDDILDITGSTKTLGKKQGSDIKLGKITYPSLIGIEQSRKIANDLYEESIEALSNTGYKFLRLKQIAKYIISRTY